MNNEDPIAFFFIQWDIKCIREMIHTAFLFAFIGFALAVPVYFISGRNCGTQNEISHLSELPKNQTQLSALKCVLTTDREGFLKWKYLKQKPSEFHIYCNCDYAVKVVK